MKPDGPEPPEATTYAGHDSEELVGRLVRFRPHYPVPHSPCCLGVEQSLWAYAAYVTRALPEGVYVRYAWEALGFLGEQLALPDELHATSCTCRACHANFSPACAGTDAAHWRTETPAHRRGHTGDDTEHANQPGADLMSEPDDDMTSLQQLVAELGITDEDLDELVHDVYSSQASRINNGGLEAQLECLLQELGADDAAAQIRELAS